MAKRSRKSAEHYERVEALRRTPPTEAEARAVMEDPNSCWPRPRDRRGRFTTVEPWWQRQRHPTLR